MENNTLLPYAVEKKKQKNKISEKTRERNIRVWLRENYPAQEEEKLDIRFLWEDFYRLNYWREKEDKGPVIVRSIFGRMIETKEKQFNFDERKEKKKYIKS